MQHKQSILIIEPDENCTDALSEILSDGSLEIEIFSKQNQIPKLSPKSLPDLILLSQKWFKENQDDILKQIVKIRQNNYIPIILICGRLSKSQIISYLNSGINDFLTRPFIPEEVIAKVKAYLSLHSIYIELNESRKQFEVLSITDSLTNLYNRRYLIERLKAEFKRAKRYSESLSCIMIDIDFFKSINDTYGHKYGDYVLSKIAFLIKNSVRDIDIPGRYGGEEFLIILPNTKQAGAVKLAEKIRRQIEIYPFQFEGKRLNVTCSFGCASMKEESSIFSYETLVIRADNALYEAKNSGRNKTCSIDDKIQMENYLFSDLTLTNQRFVSKKCILIINQLKSDIKNIKHILESRGYNSLLINNIKEATEIVKKHKIDIMILHSNSLEMEDLRILNILKIGPQNPYIPIILLSDENNTIDFKNKSIYNFIDEFLLKPFAEEEFWRKIRTCYKIKVLQDELFNISQRYENLNNKIDSAERLFTTIDSFAERINTLNNILTIILGTVQMAKKIHLQDELKQKFLAIEDASQNMSNILRDFQEQISHSHILTKTNVDINKLITQIIDNISLIDVSVITRDVSPHISFITNLSSVPKIFIKERDCLDIIQNIIYFCIEMMPNGGKIIISTQSETNDLFITISSKDVKMKIEDVEKVFEAGFTKRISSLKIDLSIVKKTIEKCQGLISAELTIPKGIKFTITFPLMPDNIKMTKQKTQKKRILVIDDNPIIGELLSDILKNNDFAVESVLQGYAGIERLKNNRYDMVFIDYILPDINGLEIAQLIKDNKIKTKIVFCTGFSVDFKDDLIKDLNISYILKKPFNLTDFEITIKNIISNVV